MPAEKPTRLNRPWPKAKSAKSPFESQLAGFLDVGGVAASGILTFGANAGDTDIVTIDAKVYTFQTVLTDVDGNVLIGATASDSLDNLIAAITLGAGSGTLYAASMTLHPTVTAVAGALDTMDATAKNEGVAGNTIVSTTDVGSATWSAATLLGGLDPADVVVFVPVVQWSSIRTRLRITGSAGTIGLEFARPARQKPPNTDGTAFVYTEDQPAADGTAWVDGTELSLEITAAEHQGENWLKVTLSPTDDGAVLDFFDISGVNIGQGS